MNETQTPPAANPGRGNWTHAKQRQHTLMKQCFSALCLRLRGLAGRFGGERLGREFSNSFNANPLCQRYRITLGDNAVNIGDDGVDWTALRQVLASMIGYTTKIAGSKTVEADIRSTVKQLEQTAGVNLFETAFKLGVLDYVQND